MRICSICLQPNISICCERNLAGSLAEDVCDINISAQSDLFFGESYKGVAGYGWLILLNFRRSGEKVLKRWFHAPLCQIDAKKHGAALQSHNYFQSNEIWITATFCSVSHFWFESQWFLLMYKNSSEQILQLPQRSSNTRPNFRCSHTLNAAEGSAHRNMKASVAFS